MGKLLEHSDLRGVALKQAPIVLLGFGKVGQAFASLLAERGGFTEEGIRLELIGIFDRSGGLMGEGLPIPEIVAAKRAGCSVAELHGISGGHRESTVLDGLSSLPRQRGVTLVDASPTDPKTGEPGLSAVRHALELGHSVVLASKGPLVHAFGDLVELAGREKCRIGMSAAVGTPLPSLETMHLSLRGAGLRGFRGIFNEASNRILIKMESGMSYQAAVENARSAGILESDPSLDLEGWDTAFKVLILARSFWGAEIPLDSVRVERHHRSDGGTFIPNPMGGAKASPHRLGSVVESGWRGGDSSRTRGAWPRRSALSACCRRERIRVRIRPHGSFRYSEWERWTFDHCCCIGERHSEYRPPSSTVRSLAVSRTAGLGRPAPSGHAALLVPRLG